MQVILKKRIPKLGNEHDVIKVKTGYARNFLLPQKLAVLATTAEIKRAESMKAKMVQKIETMLENVKEIAEKLKDAVLTFKKKSRGEKLYGSIKEKDIEDALKDQAKVEIKKEMVKMDEHLKTLGEHTVKIQLSEDVEVKIKVVIEAE